MSLTTRQFRKQVGVHRERLYRRFIHPSRCARYQKHQEANDAAWLAQEERRHAQLKIERDKAYASMLSWKHIVETTPSETWRETATKEYDRYTAMYLDAREACTKVGNEINRVHARRNHLGAKRQPATTSVAALNVQPAS